MPLNTNFDLGSKLAAPLFQYPVLCLWPVGTQLYLANRKHIFMCYVCIFLQRASNTQTSFRMNCVICKICACASFPMKFQTKESCNHSCHKCRNMSWKIWQRSLASIWRTPKPTQGNLWGLQQLRCRWFDFLLFTSIYCVFYNIIHRQLHPLLDKPWNATIYFEHWTHNHPHQSINSRYYTLNNILI